MYVCVYIYIYIYIYVTRAEAAATAIRVQDGDRCDRGPEFASGLGPMQSSTANLPTKILYFRGFDSS